MAKPDKPAPRKPSVRPRASRPPQPPAPVGLAARILAVTLIDAVLRGGRSIEDALEAAERVPDHARMAARDRAFARLIAATVLRRHGSLTAVVGEFLERPLPGDASRARSILLACAAQVLLLGTPPHAAINLAVEQCRRDPAARRFDKLANAVLRRVASAGPAVLAGLDWPRIDIPDWLWQRWVAAYGPPAAAAIAAGCLREAPLDITAPRNAEDWAFRLGGRVLPSGSIRLGEHDRIDAMEGYAEGAWWVQDAAAALPARLLGDVSGKRVADLCAAPGGKTAALAAAGAYVTAVDISATRLQRLADNVRRLGLTDRVTAVAADILDWHPAEPFDAVLLDAPCTSTGTIRRHPDILQLKRPEDLGHLVATQRRLLAHVAALVKPGGRLVYCTCSLEPEEGERQIDGFLAANPHYAREAAAAAEIGADAAWITPAGDLRTLPCHLPLEPAGLSGIDGFYAARLVRTPGP